MKKTHFLVTWASKQRNRCKGWTGKKWGGSKGFATHEEATRAASALSELGFQNVQINTRPTMPFHNVAASASQFISHLRANQSPNIAS